MSETDEKQAELFNKYATMREKARLNQLHKQLYNRKVEIAGIERKIKNLESRYCNPYDISGETEKASK